MARRYPMLRFAANVDWKDVSPVLLGRLNKLAAATHHVITIFSGYRSNAYSAANGGFAGDPHTKGIAVDATVDGKPVGSVISPSTMKKYGLRSGNQPNFYQGKPDPSHVDLVGYGGKATPGTVSQRGQEAAAATRQTGSAPVTLPGPQLPQLTTDPSELTTPPLAPGSVDPSAPEVPNYLTQAWLQVSGQQNASPDTQSYAQMFGQQ
jgi:hypothetical protein